VATQYFFSVFIIPFASNVKTKENVFSVPQNKENDIRNIVSVFMFQQRLASKHYKLHDSKLAEWRSASGHCQTEKTTGKPRKARPMAAQLKNKIF